jgi:hypothetical protein
VLPALTGVMTSFGSGRSELSPEYEESQLAVNSTKVMGPCQFIDAPSGPLGTYGLQVVNRINFVRGRIYPSFQVDASTGADIYKAERLSIRIQAEG